MQSRSSNEHSNGAENGQASDALTEPQTSTHARRERACPRLSIVLGVRDWGLDRLNLALRAHRESTLGEELELIVVDYGSQDAEALRKIALHWQATILRVEARGRWNRSHCLNVGVRAARAPRVLTTDADILFAPQTAETVLKCIADPEDFLLVQCHDLPQLAPQEIDALDFEFFARTAELRPPWGMGGCACFRKSMAVEIRGFDERMEWWGSEDNDFVQRAMQYGERVRWLDHPDARCYHIWHPKATETHAKNPTFQDVVRRNKRYVANDASIVRNAFPWGMSTPKRPAVTAAIVTRNRAHLIGETLDSLLQQTWRDFELLIVDDGSEDATSDVVKSYRDPRIRYIKKHQEGIPSARNLAVAEARGEYICVVDDDDIQLPDRIERHLGAVQDGYVGSYGGWIDFDEQTRQISHCPARPYSLEALLYASKAMIHPASCVLREVLLSQKYNPALLYGSDFDLALRIAASGYRLKHVGAYLILRRLHEHAVTTVFGSPQKRAGLHSLQRILASMTNEEVASARKAAAASKPFLIADPLQDPALRLRLPPSLARLLAAGSGDESSVEEAAFSLGRQRLLERTQVRRARLEVGPFASLAQCEIHLRRLAAQGGPSLSVEARRYGAGDLGHFILWPWSANGEAWEASEWIDRFYKYPSQVVIEESVPETPPSSTLQTKRVVSYGATVRRRSLAEAAGSLLPDGAYALVVSKGDESLLDLGRAYGAHFPQDDAGQYAGFYPADSVDAVKQLESLAQKGFHYLVFPACAFWWLEHYEGLRRHLEKACRLVHFEEGVCLIYALDGRVPDEPTGLTKPLWLSLRHSGGRPSAATNEG